MSETKDPVISIVTAVYNGADFIEDNILSVKNQDYPAIEHIIVDGGSKDDTVDIIKKYAGTYNLKWVSERDGGVYDAFNKGFRMATGDIYTWLDGDNTFHSGVLGKVAAMFQDDPSLDVVCGDIHMMSYDGKPLAEHHAPEISFEQALVKTTGAIPLQPASFFRKRVYEAVGEFDLRYPVAADYEFWLKVLKKNPRMRQVHDVFGSYRRGNAANSQSLKGIIRGYREMRIIGEDYHQPLRGKMLLAWKYFLGLLSASKKKMFN